MAATPLARLQAVFNEVNLPERVVDYWLRTCGMQSISDFIGWYDRANYAAEISGQFPGKFPVKADGPPEGQLSEERQRLFIARARTAYEKAIALEKKETAQEAEGGRP